MKRPRIKRTAKWVCTVAVLLVVVLAVATLFGSVRFSHRTADRRTTRVFLLAGGRISFSVWRRCDLMGLPNPAGWEFLERLDWASAFGGGNNPASHWRHGLQWTAPSGPACMWGGGTTLLYPFLIFSLPAALLWYSDRRRAGPGACAACGYDRSGLPGGPAAKCPECGAAGG